MFQQYNQKIFQIKNLRDNLLFWSYGISVKIRLLLLVLICLHTEKKMYIVEEEITFLCCSEFKNTYTFIISLQ